MAEARHELSPEELYKIRQDNIDAISSWLHVYGAEFPSNPQELLIIESRKLESKAAVRDWYIKNVLDQELRWDSHSLLRQIVDEELRRERWPLWMNLRDVFLADPDPDPTLIDKWIEDGGPGAKIRLAMFDDALEWAADRVRDKRGREFRLSIPIIRLATLREIGRPKQRHEKIREKFLRYRVTYGKDSTAINKVVEETAYSRSQVERITMDLRG